MNEPAATARAIATFGPPAVSYRYKEYEILTWRRGVNLLADLRSQDPLSYRDYLCRFERIWSVHLQFDIRPLVVSLLPCRLNARRVPVERDSSPVT